MFAIKDRIPRLLAIGLITFGLIGAVQATNAAPSSAANCVSMNSVDTREARTKPSGSDCLDVNVNRVYFPALTPYVTSWGQYQSNGVWRNSIMGSKKHTWGFSQSQWVAIKNLASGSKFRMNSDVNTRFDLRV